MYMGKISKRKGGFDLLKLLRTIRTILPINFYFVWEVNEVDGDIKAYIRENGLESFVEI